jgi:disulfide oxidoreductase YuzD
MKNFKAYFAECITRKNFVIFVTDAKVTMPGDDNTICGYCVNIPEPEDEYDYLYKLYELRTDWYKDDFKRIEYSDINKDKFGVGPAYCAAG